MQDIKMLSNADIDKLITVPECIPIIENLFSDLSNTQMPPKIYLDIPHGDFRAMPAVVDNTAGIKWCGVHLDETGTKRKVNIFAKVLINDIDSGKLLAIMDAEVLTAIRTAAVTGVATKHLARIGSRTAAFVGCGNQTKRQIEAVNAVTDLEAIFLYDLDQARAEELAAQFENTHVFETPEAALRDADIVTTLTPARTGFLHYKWFMPNVHINAVGADAAGKRELHKSVLHNMGIIIYDEWEQCSHSGEIQYLHECGRQPVLYSLEEIVSRQLGYNNADRRMGTLFDATGLAIEDIVTARYIYEKLNERTAK